MNVNNLLISTRLIMLIGTLSLLLIALGGIGLFGMNASNNALRTVYDDRLVPVGQLGDVGAKQISNKLLITEALLTPTPDVIAANIAAVEANRAVISKT